MIGFDSAYTDAFDSQKKRYDKHFRPFLEKNLGREMTDQEKRIVLWLCGWDEETAETILKLFNDLSNNQNRSGV